MLKRGPEQAELNLESQGKKERYTPPFFISEAELAYADNFFKRQYFSLWHNWNITTLLPGYAPSKILYKNPSQGIFHDHLQIGDQIVTLANSETENNSLLGEGGQGIVVLGRLRNGKKVAVKIENHTVEGLKDTRYQKIRACKGDDVEHKVLAHEHLLIGNLSLYPQTSNPQSPIIRQDFTVMEFAPGIELNKIDVKSLTLEQRLTIAKLCCKGLQHIHKGKFVYGDIKPANTKVMINGENIEVTFLDFGYSFELKEGETQIDIPCAFGSDDYIAPEVSKGYFLGYVSDVYSLGVMFRKVLGIDCLKEMTSHVADRRPPLDDVNQKLDSALAECRNKIHESKAKQLRLHASMK